MRRLKNQKHASQTINIFKWVTGARRALTTNELREASTIQPNQAYLDVGSLSNDIVKDIVDCGGLVYIDGEELTVHLVHHSVKQHLLSVPTDEALSVFHFDEPRLNHELGLLCLTYVNYNDFRRQLVKAKNDAGALVDPVRIAEHAICNDGSLTRRIARQLLHGRTLAKPMSRQDLDRQLQDIAGVTEASRVEAELKHRQFPFREYARVYWINHARSIQPETDQKAWHLFRNCMQTPELPVERAWEGLETRIVYERVGGKVLSKCFTEKDLRALAWAIENDNIAILRYAFPRTTIPNSMSISDAEFYQGLMFDLIKKVIPPGRKDFATAICQSLTNFRTDYGDIRCVYRCILLLATAFGLPEATNWALDRTTSNPIIAWEYEEIQMSGMELPRQPDETRKWLGQTDTRERPMIACSELRIAWSYLGLAIAFNHIEAFKILLRRFQEDHHLTLDSLAVAIIYERREMETLILDRLPEASKPHSKVFAPHSRCVFLALRHGQEDIALRILRCGINHNAVDENGDTLLRCTIFSEALEVFQELLSWGANLRSTFQVPSEMQNFLDFCHKHSEPTTKGGYDPQKLDVMRALLDAEYVRLGRARKQEVVGVAIAVLILILIAVFVEWTR